MQNRVFWGPFAKRHGLEEAVVRELVDDVLEEGARSSDGLTLVSERQMDCFRGDRGDECGTGDGDPAHGAPDPGSPRAFDAMTVWNHSLRLQLAGIAIDLDFVQREGLLYSEGLALIAKQIEIGREVNGRDPTVAVSRAHLALSAASWQEKVANTPEWKRAAVIREARGA